MRLDAQQAVQQVVALPGPQPKVPGVNRAPRAAAPRGPAGAPAAGPRGGGGAGGGGAAAPPPGGGGPPGPARGGPPAGPKTPRRAGPPPPYPPPRHCSIPSRKATAPGASGRASATQYVRSSSSSTPSAPVNPSRSVRPALASGT